MNAWPFVIAAWALTLSASVIVAAISWRAMRRAETETERPKR